MRWSAPRPAWPATTSDGRTPGSSRLCSRPGRPPVTRLWASSSWTITAPGVWSAAGRDSFVDDVQAMRRRVEENIPERQREPRTQTGCRWPAGRRVRGAVAAAGARPYRSRPAAAGHPDGAAVADPRRVRRSHRWGRDGRRLHLPAARRAPVAAAAAAPHPPAARGQLRHGVAGQDRRVHRRPASSSAAEVFVAERVRHAGTVRRLHEKLFYRPLLHAVAAVGDRRDAALPGGGPGPAGGARFPWPRTRRCGISRR